MSADMTELHGEMVLPSATADAQRQAKAEIDRLQAAVWRFEADRIERDGGGEMAVLKVRLLRAKAALLDSQRAQ